MADQRIDYYRQSRVELIPSIPSDVDTVLDVGCAGGAFGEALMEARPGIQVDGVEKDREVARHAAGSYRTVLVGEFPDVMPSSTYDAIVYNDVLEHLYDPWMAVRSSRPLLNVGGVLVASIPNMRYWPDALGPLLRGSWSYRDSGVLDRTHIRWFTKASMSEMIANAGFEVISVERLTGTRGNVKWRIAALFFPRLVKDVLTKQYVVVARVRGFSGTE